MFSYFSSFRIKKVAAYWGIAAHSDYHMFSWYTYLGAILLFSTPRFMVWEYLSDCAIFHHCLLVPFLHIVSSKNKMAA